MKVKEDIDYRERKKNNMSAQAFLEGSPNNDKLKQSVSKEQHLKMIERLSKPKPKPSSPDIKIVVIIYQEVT